ncbi:PREDICTED: uncharacterized protein LOC107345445 [Acropora digitifera]|uniref:uncharacterized protein LOC107345445 n=1 Tax=Acropora digitifera TaxID=70779 RepID=UPI00077A45C5|nr:PREDICTED: uncharacterized protein LOC107345445 [Acropora digitifera]
MNVDLTAGHRYIMRKRNLVKRKHSTEKNSASKNSSSEEEDSPVLLQKNNLTKGKKAKERTSPPTTEDENKDNVELCREIESGHRKDELDCRKVDPGKEDKTVVNSTSVKMSEASTSKDQEDQDKNIVNATEKSAKQLVSSIKDKMNISQSKNGKPANRNLYLFDFLGEEVSNDESQALQALNSFWVNSVARNKDVLKRPPPRNQQEQDFYNKYCDKHGKLSIAAATRLMRLPYVITVCLKNKAQIEVIVSNRQKALEESEELRENFFEVVEAMAMHLM